MRNLTLIGQMGAGKSAVARALAARWSEAGWRPVDLDAVIEARAGASIEAIFTQQGEEAFRKLEAEALATSLASTRQVIATGGGAPCRAGAIDAVRAAGTVVWLRATAETLAARALDGARPLLAGLDLAGARDYLNAQLVERGPFYRQAHVVVDTDGKTVAQVCRAIEAAVGRPPLATLQVELGARSYPIELVEGLPGPHLRRVVQRVAPQAAAALLVTDSNVAPLYAAGVTAALSLAGLRPIMFQLQAGESSKHLATVSAAIDTALAAGLGRRDIVVALGGGVVGDIAGFVASVLHRGVDFIQVPTTLLAQVDSSVGGKTGVNHPTGKNLIGAFWQPRWVLASQAVLQTLPQREVRCGLAEALKHGLIADRQLLDRARDQRDALLRLDPAATARLVAACCGIKAEIVAADERDRGKRALLNYGHTFGHAFERLLGYGALSHGEAVGLGMVFAARLSTRLGVAGDDVEPLTVDLLADFGLPHDPDAAGPTLDALLEAARSDKKAHSAGVDFILLSEIGKALVRPLSWDRIRQALGGPRE